MNSEKSSKANLINGANYHHQMDSIHRNISFGLLKDEFGFFWNLGGLLKNPPKCFKIFSMCRRVLRVSAFESSDIGECFTYPERLRTTRRNFSTGF